MLVDSLEKKVKMLDPHNLYRKEYARQLTASPCHIDALKTDNLLIFVMDVCNTSTSSFYLGAIEAVCILARKPILHRRS